jgi:hypothetical protein
MTLRIPIIALALLVGLVLLDLVVSSWQLAVVSPMSAFPALMFAAMSTFSQRQTATARVLCAFVALAAASVFVALKLNAP